VYFGLKLLSNDLINSSFVVKLSSFIE